MNSGSLPSRGGRGVTIAGTKVAKVSFLPLKEGEEAGCLFVVEDF